jgi:hypothetical protein
MMPDPEKEKRGLKSNATCDILGSRKAPTPKWMPSGQVIYLSVRGAHPVADGVGIIYAIGNLTFPMA